MKVSTNQVSIAQCCPLLDLLCMEGSIAQCYWLATPPPPLVVVFMEEVSAGEQPARLPTKQCNSAGWLLSSITSIKCIMLQVKILVLVQKLQNTDAASKASEKTV